MSQKYNTKQRYKSIQGLRSFKDTLPKEAKRILNKKGDVYNKTLDNWKYIVGKELFKECYPKSFKGSNKVKNSCLTIMVKSCLLYTSPSPRDRSLSRMPSSA